MQDMNRSMIIKWIQCFAVVLSIGLASPAKQITNYGSCQNYFGEISICVYLNNCPFILNMLKPNMSAAEKSIVRRSQCGYTGGKILVCCPDIVSNSEEAKPALRSITSTRQPVQECQTPNNVTSVCVALNQCESIDAMTRDTLLSTEDAAYIRKSICNTPGRNRMVCCPDQYIGPYHKKAIEITTTTKAYVLLPELGECGNGVILDRIHGGRMTTIEEHPWMALIEYTKDGRSVGFHCAGSLISKRYVITAAHCRYDLPGLWTMGRVRLGEWNTTSDIDCIGRGNYRVCAAPPVDIDVEKVITHAKYIANSRYHFDDIALLRLSRNVNFTDFIQPICLPFPKALNRINFEGKMMEIVGWGSTETGSRSSVKLKASIPIANFNNCKQIYRQHQLDVKKTQICAGGKIGVDTCTGDSGGPLVGSDTTDDGLIYKFIAGIVSYGPISCGEGGWPGLYTNVSEYLDWILNSIEP